MAALFGTRDSFVLEQSPSAPARARLLVATALETWGVASDFPDVALITSELVTNAVVHAAGDVVLTLDLTNRLLRIEVSDLSSDEPIMRDAEPSGAGGWGLRLVDALATGWGLEISPNGKTVWCDIAPSNIHGSSRSGVDAP